jgi:hypothetical protein
VNKPIENGEHPNFFNQEEEELEDLDEELKKRQREKQRFGRGRGANRKDREMVNSIAREKGMDKIQRQQFGDYIEKIKRQEGRGGSDNFTRDELLDLADEFLDL